MPDIFSELKKDAIEVYKERKTYFPDLKIIEECESVYAGIDYEEYGDETPCLNASYIITVEREETDTEMTNRISIEFESKNILSDYIKNDINIKFSEDKDSIFLYYFDSVIEFQFIDKSKKNTVIRKFSAKNCIEEKYTYIKNLFRSKVLEVK